MNRKLTLLASLYLVNAGLGTAVAIRDDVPAAFLGVRTGKPASRDFVFGMGTGLSAPLPMLVAHALFVGLAFRGYRAGVVGLRAGAALFAVGMLGEPITYQALNPRTFDAPKAFVIVGNLILPCLMLASGRGDR